MKKSTSQKETLIKYPELIKEWDFEKNSIMPDEVLPRSNKKVWWKCKFGHRWQSTPNNRINGRGCPVCSGRLVMAGVNDLATKNPELALEWDYVKNYPLTPCDVTSGKNIKAWWICSKCGNEWEANISRRNRGSGCPKCARRFHSSFPEQAIFFYIQQANEDAINSYKTIFDNGMEIDIYIPSLKTGIEYDGERYHKGKKREKDVRKYQICKNHGIKLIRIRESLEEDYSDICDIQIPSDFNSSNVKAIDDILNDLSQYIPVGEHDIRRDQLLVMEQIKSVLSNRSLASEYPELVKEWNYEKNGKLTPEMFLSGSGDRVWWRCKKGHEWQAAIHPRTTGVGCPYCSNKKVLAGYNDLATTDPKLLLEWDYEKNVDIKPDSITRRMSKKVWWRCEKGHSFLSRVDHRTTGHGCPYCSGMKAEKGINDLQTSYPDLLKEWDYDKNKGTDPSNYLPGSEKKVWWHCGECGNSWAAAIANRVNGHGCPACGTRKGIKNALQTKIKLNGSFEDWCKTNKEKEYLLKEWSDENDIRPSQVLPKSYEKIIWQCSTCGYKWKSEVFKRADRDKTCPVCTNRIALKGYNDLATLKPTVASQWDYEKNGDLRPEQFTAGSSKKVWWIGDCGHSWNAKISDRAIKNYGCPYCNGARILKGFNDLVTVDPELAKEWCYEKNTISPESVSPNSHKKVFWKCKNGHVWEAQIKSRHMGTGCPVCYANRIKDNKTSEVRAQQIVFDFIELNSVNK